MFNVCFDVLAVELFQNIERNFAGSETFDCYRVRKLGIFLFELSLNFFRGKADFELFFHCAEMIDFVIHFFLRLKRYCQKTVVFTNVSGAKGGTRTPTVARQILSLVRLPVPPLSQEYNFPPFRKAKKLCRVIKSRKKMVGPKGFEPSTH